MDTVELLREITEAVELKLLGPVHRYVKEVVPLLTKGVMTNVDPWHTAGALMVTIGVGFTFTVTVAVFVQPKSSVTVTVYVLVEVGETNFEAPEPNPSLHAYVYGAIPLEATAEIVIELPEQMVPPVVVKLI